MRTAALTRVLPGLLVVTLVSGQAAAQAPLPSASIIVKDAGGQPVEGATACIGTVSGAGEYGQTFTNEMGIALFSGPLPEGPATIYFTAGKDGRGAQTAQSYVAPIAPIGLVSHIQLPASPGGILCPEAATGPSAPPTASIEGILERMEAPSELESRELFEVKLILKRPPPVSVAVTLESSHPHLVALPRQITIRPSQRAVLIPAEVIGEVRFPETVILTGRLERDLMQVVRWRIVVKPAGRTSKIDGGD